MFLEGHGTLLVVGVVVLAGCSGTLVEYAASPATLPAPALEASGYVHGNTTEVPLTYRAGMFGISRDVTARTWVSGYSKTTAANETAILLLYSSPDVRVEGQSVNPLTQLSNRELASFVLDRVSDLRTAGGVANVSDLREVSSRNVTVLGEPARTVSYAGTAEVDGERIGVVVDVTVVEHGEDVVIALGIYGDVLDETANHVRLVERMEHEGGG
jgi:hypothetical protein